MAILVLTLAIFLVFWGVTKTFYQQDEWHGLGDILAFGPKFVFLNINGPISLLSGGSRLFGNLLVYFFYSRFPFQVFPIAVFAILLHLSNTILVFLLGQKVTNKIIPSFLGALFFGVNAVSQGSVTWPASGIATLPAAFFIILSLFSFLEFIEKRNKRGIFLTFIFLYISLFFKETATPFFLFFAFSYLIFKRISIRALLNNFWIFLIFVIGIVGFRLFQFKSISTQQDLFLTGASSSFVLTLAIRAILYPFTSFSLLWIPPELSFAIAKQLTWNYYSFLPPSLYDLVAQTAVLDLLAVFLGSIFLFFIYILFKSEKAEIKKRVVFFLGFVLLSFLPYIVISKTFSYLESRYYYIAVVGAGVLLSLVISKVSTVLNRKIFVAFVVVILLFDFVHIKSVRNEIKRQISLGQERIKILDEIDNIKPSLNRKTLFYISGDKDSYYIARGNSLPMQQGVGNTLLVWYMTRGKAPAELVALAKKYYLWEMDGEGYEEVNNSGFGYFWDIKELKNAIHENKITKDNFVALYYDSGYQTMTNNTDKIWKELNISERK
jgi:hypothetical protein